MFEVPTRLVDYRCSLKAVDPPRNIARAYRIVATTDLFGHVIVDLTWGRIGHRGAGMAVSFASEIAAQKFFRRVLNRRATAPRRIGASYTIVETAYRTGTDIGEPTAIT